MSTIASLLRRSLDFESGILSARRTSLRYVLTPTPEARFKALAAIAKRLPHLQADRILSHYDGRTDIDGRLYTVEYKPGIRCLDVDNRERRARLPVLADERAGELEIAVPRKECDSCEHFRGGKRPYCQFARDRLRGSTARMVNRAVSDAQEIVKGNVPHREDPSL